MGSARVAAELSGSPGAAERRWSDPAGWAAFVDGFERVVELDPAWPAEGARLVWQSHAGGRGRVVERVVARTPGAELVVAVEDPQLRGTQRIAFAPCERGVRVVLELRYELLRRGPFMLLADPLFVRRALRDSLRRTLDQLGAELAGAFERPA